MKGSNPSLFGALLLSLLVRCLLRAQTLYWTRTGLLTLVPGVLFSALAGILFARAWPVAKCRLLCLLFSAVLMLGAIQDLLSLWRLYTAAYPDAVSLFGICLTVLIPVLYLRRVSSIAQTANVVLGLLLAAALVLVLSLASRLQIVNLQADTSAADLKNAVAARCVIFPELLLPALRQEKKQPVNRTVFRLAAFGSLFEVGMHLILELFYGAAMPQMDNPLHQAARCGSLSVFDRLEWLQLIVWTMALSVKLGLYGYAAAYLLGLHTAGENSLHGLPRCIGVSALLTALCLLAARREPAELAVWQNAAVWSLLGAAVLWGGIRWVIRKPAAGSA